MCMMVGGNARAAEFFRKKGWLGGGDKQAEKYRSRAAQLYKEHISHERTYARHTALLLVDEHVRQPAVGPASGRNLR